jgi:hypothetical protein
MEVDVKKGKRPRVDGGHLERVINSDKTVSEPD